MKTLPLAAALTFHLCCIAAAKADLALFNGLPVSSGDNSSAAVAYSNMQAALERGQPQKLIVEYLVSGQPGDNQQKLDTFSMIKRATLESFDSTDTELVRNYSHLPMSVLRVNNSQGLEQVMSHPQIKAVYEDTVQRLFLNESLPLIQQPAAVALGDTGAGTSVAILDTGVDYTHAAFGNCTAPGEPETCKVTHAEDFAPDDGNPDTHGHGTNVAGIALGVAPDTSILALDVFDGEDAFSSDVIKAINWSIANKATYNIAAINMSLGSGRYISECYTSVFATPISDAKAAGILVAVASGNDGYKDAVATPACAPGAVSVGAVYDASMDPVNWNTCVDNPVADKVTCFSNSALFLDLLAPGALITAAETVMGGTSQAAPHVTGAAAILAGAFPSESVDQWLARLKITGVIVTDETNDVSTVRIDIHGAVNSFSESECPDLNNKVYGSGDSETCTVTSLISFGPEIKMDTGATVSLNSPEVAVYAPVSIAHGAVFSVETPEVAPPEVLEAEVFELNIDVSNHYDGHIAPLSRHAYHFRSPTRESIEEPYENRYIRFGVVDFGAEVSLNLGLSKVLGRTQPGTGEAVECFTGPGTELSLSMATDDKYTDCIMEFDTDYYFNIESLDETITGGYRFSFGKGGEY